MIVIVFENSDTQQLIGDILDYELNIHEFTIGCGLCWDITYVASDLSVLIKLLAIQIDSSLKFTFKIDLQWLS